MIGLARKLPSRKTPSVEVAQRSGSLYHLAPDVVGLRLGMVNVYFLGKPGTSNWVLVDAGLPGAGKKIRKFAAQRFGAGIKPAAIILTHGHFDHVGGLHDLLAHWNVNVFAHRLELPYLTGRSSYPPPDPSVGGGLLSWASRFYPIKPIVLGSHVQALPGDGSVPGIEGWRWLHTPGHSVGHISLFRDTDRTMIAGDAFVTVCQESLFCVLTQKPELRGPPAYFTCDWQAAHESVDYLLSMSPMRVGAGHGQPLIGEQMLKDLRQLARHFDVDSVPRQGRYVENPALAGLHGVLSLPPTADHSSGRVLLLVAVTVAALWLGTAFINRRRRQKLFG